MRLVHTFVAEVLGELVDSGKTAHDEALEVQFIGNTHIHIHIQGVVVGDERTGRGTTGDGLQDGGFHLQAAGLVEALPHRVHNLGALEEHFLHLRIHHQVYVALAVTQLRIFEAVVHGAVGIRLHDGKNTQGLAQHGEFLGVNGQLARLGEEGKALDTHEVSDVQELFEHGVIQGFVL